MKQLVLVLGILVFSISNIIAQDEDLESKLKSASKEEKLEIYNQLVDENCTQNVEKCIEYAEELQKLAKKLDNQNYEIKACAFLANLYYEQGDYKKSNKYFEEELLLTQNKGDKLEVAKSYYNLATSYLKTENNSKARINFDRSLDLSIELNYKPLMIANYKALSKVNNDQGKYMYALEDLKKYILYAEGEFSEQVDLFKEQYFQEKKIKENKIQQLNVTQNELNVTKTELVETEEVVAELEEDTLKKSEKINELNYENEYNQLMITHKEEELEQQRFVTYTFIIGFGIILLFSLLILRMFLNKKKMNKILTIQKAEITESIKYASRIQAAVLPIEDDFKALFSDYFIFYKPRDIVSGDFYFLQKVNNYVLFSAIDCTGHGVPGAFMSMLGMAYLNEIVRKKEVTQANHVLNLLREQVKTSLKQTGEKGARKDGMDMALCVINLDTNELQYAGAYNPLLIVRNDELLEYKADRMPIGVYIKEKETFTNHRIELKKGDKIYMYSDGFTDQIGGEAKDKFMSKPFKNLLLETSRLKMNDQKSKIEQTFNQWKGNNHQIDDIVIIGVTV